MLWMGSALALQKLGRLEEANSFLARLDLEDNQEFATVQRADIYAQRNEADLAMQSLDLAYELGDPGLSQVLVDPFLDPLRDDPRFIQLVEKLGFEPPTPG